MTKDKISLLRRFWALWHLRAACFAQGQKQEIGRFKSRAALLTKQNEDLLARVCRPQSMEPKWAARTRVSDWDPGSRNSRARELGWLIFKVLEC